MGFAANPLSGRKALAGKQAAAAPFLFYADWTHAIAPRFANVRAYRERLLARPSVARAVDEPVRTGICSRSARPTEPEGRGPAEDARSC